MFSARSSTDPDGDSLTYAWLAGDGRVFSEPFEPSEQGWSYPNNGVDTVSVVVTDQRGAADTASTTVTIVNAPPYGVGVYPPRQLAVGIPGSARVTFGDSGAVDTHSLTVIWGDGTSDSMPAADSTPWLSKQLVHAYRSPGSYRITAMVRDNDGGEASGTAKYSVTVFDASEHQSIAGYDAFDIGTLGGNSASPMDFNDYGKIVGSSRTASGSTHAFLWENGVMRDLGTLDHDGSEARRINNAGVISGSVWTVSNFDPVRHARAATWSNGLGRVLDSMGVSEPIFAAAMDELDLTGWTSCGHETCHGWTWNHVWQQIEGLLGPYSEVFISAMNKRGQIVGSSAAVYTGLSPDPAQHAFLWEDGVIRDLGLLSGNPCRDYPDRICGYSAATSINESGQVVGYSSAADESEHVVLWENGTVRSLWRMPQSHTSARPVINDRSQVAWSAGGDGFFWSAGTLRPLGSLGGGGTIVVDMNEAGTVVGTSKTASGERHVFVWTEQGGMVDLRTGPHGFNTAGVVGISFRGDIVGFSAPCTPGDNNSCDYPSQPRAIMWRKQ